MNIRRRDESGFTLIELLVVMIIIGILAAIAIPTYLKSRDHAYRTTALTDMRDAADIVNSYAASHDGSFAGLDGATEASPDLYDEGLRTNVWTHLLVHATATSFCIEGTHSHLPGETLVFKSDSGVISFVLGGGATC